MDNVSCPLRRPYVGRDILKKFTFWLKRCYISNVDYHNVINLLKTDFGRRYGFLSGDFIIILKIAGKEMFCSILQPAVGISVQVTPPNDKTPAHSAAKHTGQASTLDRQAH